MIVKEAEHHLLLPLVSVCIGSDHAAGRGSCKSCQLL